MQRKWSKSCRRIQWSVQSRRILLAMRVICSLLFISSSIFLVQLFNSASKLQLQKKWISSFNLQLTDILSCFCFSHIIFLENVNSTYVCATAMAFVMQWEKGYAVRELQWSWLHWRFPQHLWSIELYIFHDWYSIISTNLYTIAEQHFS